MTSVSTAPAWSSSPKQGQAATIIGELDTTCSDRPTSPALSSTSTTDRSVCSCDGAPSSTSPRDHPRACPDGSGHEEASSIDGQGAGIASLPVVSSDGLEDAQDWEVPQSLQLDEQAHEMDKASAPDELLDVWAETEAKLFEILSGSQSPLPWDPHGGRADSSSGMARARHVCLVLMERYIRRSLHLDVLAWFQAASILDLYLVVSHQKGRGVRVEALPAVCTVILRMQWKDNSNSDSNSVPGVNPTSRGVFQAILEGFKKQLADMIESEEKLGDDLQSVFMHVELEILQTLGWKVHSPCLSKWLLIFFRRLECSVDAEQQDLVKTLQSASLEHLFQMTVKLIPSPDLPPQRVARGLLVIYSMLTRVTPTVQSSPALHGQAELREGLLTVNDVARDYLQSFERVTGASEEVLSEDCRLAFRAVHAAGVDVAGVRTLTTGPREYDI